MMRKSYGIVRGAVFDTFSTDPNKRPPFEKTLETIGTLNSMCQVKCVRRRVADDPQLILACYALASVDLDALYVCLMLVRGVLLEHSKPFLETSEERRLRAMSAVIDTLSEAESAANPKEDLDRIYDLKALSFTVTQLGFPRLAKEIGTSDFTPDGVSIQHIFRADLSNQRSIL